ncbi:MAG: DUF6197 family protein [Beijerinckiaceae bacterium]
MSTVDPIIFRNAAKYIDAHGWTQGTEENEAGEVCLTGAIRKCASVPGDFALVREVLRKRGRAEDWNDEEATKTKVAKYLRTAEVTDADLADTFGPQWAEIVTFVRRVAVLNEGELEPVPAYREAAWAEAWAAAWDASRAAARDVMRDAAWAAAQEAARDAQWEMSWAAARALAVRDLIGQHDFTQAHYDTLTAPLRKSGITVHPDDAELA